MSTHESESKRGSAANPNNCETCDHFKHPDGGHCYMFREAPTYVCLIHSLPPSLRATRNPYDLNGMKEYPGE